MLEYCSVSWVSEFTCFINLVCCPQSSAIWCIPYLFLSMLLFWHIKMLFSSCCISLICLSLVTLNVCWWEVQFLLSPASCWFSGVGLELFWKRSGWQLDTSWVALGQGTAPAVLHSLVSMPLGLAWAHTKTCGQVTVVAGTATLCTRGNIPQGSTASNCSFSFKYEGGSERGKKAQPAPEHYHLIGISSQFGSLSLSRCQVFAFWCDNGVA